MEYEISSTGINKNLGKRLTHIYYFLHNIYLFSYFSCFFFGWTDQTFGICQYISLDTNYS